MQGSTKFEEENQFFQESGINIPIETEKNQLISLEEMMTSERIPKKKLVNFNKNTVSIFSIKSEDFIEKVIRKLALKAPENRNEISRILKEKFKDFKGSNFSIWIHYYFLYVDKDEAILQEITEGLKEQRKSLISQKETREPQIFLEPKEKIEKIVKILDFFLENESFHSIFFARTMRKLLIKSNEIPLDFIKKIINLERFDFLNEMLKFKEKN